MLLNGTQEHCYLFKEIENESLVFIELAIVHDDVVRTQKKFVKHEAKTSGVLLRNFSSVLSTPLCIVTP